ncbi:MAG: VOC family protein [Isosphaeraceae bacterium]
MASSVTPLLMFDGTVEAATTFHVSLFPGSEITRMDRYGPGEPGAEGSVKRADFTIAGQRVMRIDSPTKHAFMFSPSVSLFVECESEAELDAALDRLSAGGSAMMPPDDHGFSKKFTWVNDRFGVSWQLNFQ